MQQFPTGSDLDELVAFVAVATTGSFTRAAMQQGRDATALSRRVSSLEQRLGVRLFERTTRRVALTEAGAALFARVGPNVSAISEAEAEAASHASGEPRGTLRISLPSTFGRLWIAPILPAFAAQYPKLKLKLEFSNSFVDLIALGFDAAVRIGSLPDSTLVARRLAGHRRLLCAAPGYLEKHGAPMHPTDLNRHVCLGFTGFNSYPDWNLESSGGSDRVSVRIDSPYVSNDAEALISAAVSGAGIMMCTDWLIGRELKSGALVPVLSQWSPLDEGAIYVVVPSGRHLSQKSRVFIDWLSTRFDAGPPWCAL
jgi:DNA-binding transcriptional LysR family regulator